MFLFNTKFIFKTVSSFSLLAALTACGSNDKTSEVLQSVTLGLDGSYQLVGTSCSDGSKPVNFSQIEQTAFSKLDHEMTEFCRLELDPQREKFARLNATQADLSARIREIELKLSQLYSEFTSLNASLENMRSDAAAAFLSNGDGLEAKILLVDSSIGKLEIEQADKIKKLEEIASQIELAESALSVAHQSFKDGFQCEKQENLRGAGEVLKLFRDSLYNDFAVPQVLASQLIAADGEKKRDFIPESLWRVILPQLELIRRSVARALPSLVEFSSKAHGVSKPVRPFDTLTDPEQDKYLESGKESDQDLQSVSERDSLEIRFEIENGTLWTVYENKANQCVQKFPAEMEMSSDGHIEIFPSLDLLATCSDSCGRLENELCDRFSANVKSQYSEKQKRSLNLEEARSILYPDSSIRFQYSKDSENLLLTRVTRDSGEPLAIVSTKKLRLEIDEDSLCETSVNTSFAFQKLQNSSSSDQIE